MGGARFVRGFGFGAGRVLVLGVDFALALDFFFGVLEAFAFDLAALAFFGVLDAAASAAFGAALDCLRFSFCFALRIFDLAALLAAATRSAATRSASSSTSNCAASFLAKSPSEEACAAARRGRGICEVEK